MPPKKRKAPSSTAEAPPTPSTTPGKKKMTKKEKQEALERARQWAVQERMAKSNGYVVTATSSPDEQQPTPARKKRRVVSQPQPTPSPATTSSVGGVTFAANATPTRTKKTARASISPKRTAARSTATKSKRSQSNRRKSAPILPRPNTATTAVAGTPLSTKKKTTKQQQLKEAQERAAAWAAKESEKSRTNHTDTDTLDAMDDDDEGSTTVFTEQRDVDTGTGIADQQETDEEDDEDEIIMEHNDTTYNREVMEEAVPQPPNSVAKKSGKSSSTKKQREREQLEARARAAVWAKEESARKKLLQQQQQQEVAYVPPPPILSPQYDGGRTIAVHAPSPTAAQAHLNSPGINNNFDSPPLGQNLRQTQPTANIIHDSEEEGLPDARRLANDLRVQQQEHQRFVQEHRNRQLDIQRQTVDELDQLLNNVGSDGQDNADDSSNHGGVTEDDEEEYDERTFLPFLSARKSLFAAVILAILFGGIFMNRIHFNDTLKTLSAWQQEASSMLPSTNMSTIEIPHLFQTKQKQGPPCFRSSFEDDDETITVPPQWLLDNGIETCTEVVPKVGETNTPTLVPCPTNGICSGGYLQSCSHDFLQVAKGAGGGEQCVLTKAANDTLKKVELALANHTSNYVCSWDGSTGCDLVVDNSNEEPPHMFDLEKLLLSSEVELSSAMPILLYASESSPIFQIAERQSTSLENDTSIDVTLLYIGLKEAYVKHFLDIPFGCWISILLSDLMTSLWNGFFQSLWYCFKYCFKTLKFICLNVFAKSPITSLVLISLAWLGRKVFKDRRDKVQFRKDVFETKTIAFNKLQRVDKFVVLQLRDDIAHELHPISRKNRDYIINTVWPVVVREVKADNRIMKSETMSSKNKPRDVWAWTAPRTAHYRQTKKNN